MTILQQGQAYAGGTVQYDSATGQRLAPGATTVTNDALSSPAPSTIQATMMAPGTPSVTQSPQTDPHYSLVNSVNNAVTMGVQDVNKAETAYDQQVNDLQGYYQQLGNKASDQIKNENDLGLPQLNNEILDLQAKADQTKKEYDLTPYSMAGQGRGITTGLLRGQEAVKQRQIAVENIMVNAELAAKQGKAKYAQSLADRATSLKYDPIIAKIDMANKFLETSKYKLSRADQKLADAKIEQNNQQKQQYEEKKYNEQQNTSTLFNLIQSYPDAGISPTDTIQQANTKIVSKSAIYKDKIRPPQGASGAPKTLEERQNLILNDYNFIAGAKMSDGTPAVDPNGYITPKAFHAALDDATSRGANRDKFIERFGSKLFLDPKTGTVPDTYGLTPKEKKLITG